MMLLARVSDQAGLRGLRGVNGERPGVATARRFRARPAGRGGCRAARRRARPGPGCSADRAGNTAVSEPEGRGAAWTEERVTKERATREGGASKAPRRRAGKHSEPEGRGAASTEERVTRERAT